MKTDEIKKKFGLEKFQRVRKYKVGNMIYRIFSHPVNDDEDFDELPDDQLVKENVDTGEVTINEQRIDYEAKVLAYLNGLNMAEVNIDTVTKALREGFYHDFIEWVFKNIRVTALRSSEIGNPFKHIEGWLTPSMVMQDDGHCDIWDHTEGDLYEIGLYDSTGGSYLSESCFSYNIGYDLKTKKFVHFWLNTD